VALPGEPSKQAKCGVEAVDDPVGGSDVIASDIFPDRVQVGTGFGRQAGSSASLVLFLAGTARRTASANCPDDRFAVMSLAAAGG